MAAVTWDPKGSCAHEPLKGEKQSLDDFVALGEHNVNNGGHIGRFLLYYDPGRDMLRIDCSNCERTYYRIGTQEPLGLPFSFAHVWNETFERYKRHLSS